MRAIPDEAVRIVAKWEGFKPLAYLCPAGVPTIGFGHTKTVSRADVATGRKITRADAEALLRRDLEDARAKLYRASAPAMASLTRQQYAALISFAYNLGWSNRWGIARALRDGRIGDVPAEMRKFVNAGGRRLQGLVNRREDEVRLWNGAPPQ